MTEYIPKREAELKSKFGEEVKRQLPDFLSLSYSTNGAPDREIIGAGITTRWEFKFATPTFRSPGDQELMCMRLAAAGHCRYVLWRETKGIQKTMIVHPKAVYHRAGWEIDAEAWCVGFDMKWLIDYVRKEHRQ